MPSTTKRAPPTAHWESDTDDESKQIPPSPPPCTHTSTPKGGGLAPASSHPIPSRPIPSPFQRTLKHVALADPALGPEPGRGPEVGDLDLVVLAHQNVIGLKMQNSEIITSTGIGHRIASTNRHSISIGTVDHHVGSPLDRAPSCPPITFPPPCAK